MINTYGFVSIPNGEAYKQFEAVINRYGKELNAPTYLPHLTLMQTVEGEEVEIVKQVETVAQEIKPFNVTTGRIDFSTTYFQCVFMRINANAALMDAHLKFKSALLYEKNHVFMPHVSLVYGDFDMATREKISKEIQLSELEFMVDNIAIIIGNQPDPLTWKIVKQISFKGV